WDYFALDNLNYRERRVTILWDRTGKRYGKGAGFHVLVGGEKIASAGKLERLTAKLPARERVEYLSAVNYAVNNDGRYYPPVSTSSTPPLMPVYNSNDGNSWYDTSPPNRWTCEGSRSARDWVAIDFGMNRRVAFVSLHFLDDDKVVVPPESYDVEYWD